MKTGSAFFTAVAAVVLTAGIVSADGISIVDSNDVDVDIWFTPNEADYPGNGLWNFNGVMNFEYLSFGERFAGQEVQADGLLDQLTGTPTAPLTPAAGEDGYNLAIYEDRFNSATLQGIGTLGFPDYDALGEGALSVWFSLDQTQFLLDLEDARGAFGPTAFDITFYRRDASIIDVISFTDFSDYTPSLGIKRDNNVADIAGFTIVATDVGGVGIDGIAYTIPAPSSLILLAGGGLFVRRHPRVVNQV